MLHRARRAAEWAAFVLGMAGAALRRLPLRVGLFYVGALALAVLRRDRFALSSATRPADLEALLELAGESVSVAELGTGPGWSAIALALVEPRRQIVTFDIDSRDRDAYLRLVPRSVRERVRFVLGDGAAGADDAPEVDFVFIDSSHTRDGTLREFEAWRPKLSGEGVVAFHDYGNPHYPGVEEAVTELGLEGRVEGDVFVWRAA